MALLQTSQTDAQEGNHINNLNSVLIEGEVEAEPFPGGGIEGHGPYEWVAFKLKSSRYEKQQDSSLKVQENHFSILTKGHLAETVRDFVHVGRKVRVVGRLVGEDPSHVVIHAEHVEFAPQFKKKTS